MILYTTMPQELIFQTDESEFSKQTIIQYEGIPLLVEMDDNHDYRVIQVMSSDPSHYLDDRCYPGNILSNRKF
ncbi:YlzJ-like family protein [Bacillus sp. V3B]|uniref:YlzJ-like family protein n=1 Tax=Bacillus sp. V3B TaxID=2804915 RepID=UPI00210B742B|nr:YlzJ-like family protein [Bacillus sp. V3B]MCQ6274158.1 YlzJ-like family protein [Bacillus sp. V3B]